MTDSNVAEMTPPDSAEVTRLTPRITKAATVRKLLSRNRGATLAELMAATNWQPHSTRAFLSGLRKGGKTLEKEARKNGETAYRLGA
jgi:hypothetical protein